MKLDQKYSLLICRNGEIPKSLDKKLSFMTWEFRQALIKILQLDIMELL